MIDALKQTANIIEIDESKDSISQDGLLNKFYDKALINLCDDTLKRDITTNEIINI